MNMNLANSSLHESVVLHWSSIKLLFIAIKKIVILIDLYDFDASMS